MFRRETSLLLFMSVKLVNVDINGIKKRIHRITLHSPHECFSVCSPTTANVSLWKLFSHTKPYHSKRFLLKTVFPCEALQQRIFIVKTVFLWLKLPSWTFFHILANHVSSYTAAIWSGMDVAKNKFMLCQQTEVSGVKTEKCNVWLICGELMLDPEKYDLKPSVSNREYSILGPVGQTQMFGVNAFIANPAGSKFGLGRSANPS